MKKLLTLTLLAASLSGFAQEGGLKMPFNFENAKVLPKGIKNIILMHAQMRGILDREFKCPTYVDEKEQKPPGRRDLRFVADGQVIELGTLSVHVIETPGHTAGGVTYRVNNTLLSGDAIFAGSMGRANSSWDDLYNSITTRLFAFPPETLIHPGHGPATTVGEEKRNNPFFAGKTI